MDSTATGTQSSLIATGVTTGLAQALSPVKRMADGSLTSPDVYPDVSSPTDFCTRFA